MSELDVENRYDLNVWSLILLFVFSGFAWYFDSISRPLTAFLFIVMGAFVLLAVEAWRKRVCQPFGRKAQTQQHPFSLKEPEAQRNRKLHES